MSRLTLGKKKIWEFDGDFVGAKKHVFCNIFVLI